MNLKKRATTLLILTGIFNVMVIVYWLNPIAYKALGGYALYLGLAASWIGFGFIYRASGYSASSKSRYHNWAFYLVVLNLVLNAIGIHIGLYLIEIAAAIVLVQYGRFFLTLERKELRDILCLVAVVVVCCMLIFVQLEVMSILLYYCITMGFIALIALEHLLSGRGEQVPAVLQPGASPLGGGPQNSDNPFDQPL